MIGFPSCILVSLRGFIVLMGFSLVAEGLTLHIPKGYIYFAMGFSVFIEMLNLCLGGRAEQPVRLHQRDVTNGRAQPGVDQPAAEGAA